MLWRAGSLLTKLGSQVPVTNDFLSLPPVRACHLSRRDREEASAQNLALHIIRAHRWHKKKNSLSFSLVTMARWGVSSWLVLVRGLQILGVLVSALCNGFLLVYIHVNKLGLTSAMSALEIMVRGNICLLSSSLNLHVYCKISFMSSLSLSLSHLFLAG